MKICQDCRKEYSDDISFCVNCGKRLVGSDGKPICAFCGSEYTPESKFCPNCGKKAGDAPPSVGSKKAPFSHIFASLKSTSIKQKVWLLLFTAIVCFLVNVIFTGGPYSVFTHYNGIGARVPISMIEMFDTIPFFGYVFAASSAAALILYWYAVVCDLLGRKCYFSKPKKKYGLIAVSAFLFGLGILLGKFAFSGKWPDVNTIIIKIPPGTPVEHTTLQGKSIVAFAVVYVIVFLFSFIRDIKNKTKATSHNSRLTP